MVLIPSNRSHFLFPSLILSLLIILTIEKPDPEAMRVHPIPRNLNNNNTLIHHHRRNPTREPGKNLRRLPHIFNRVLELPLRSEANVSVEEKHDCFRFVAETEGLCDGGEMRAYVVDIHPGITKIVVRTNGLSLGLSLDELELDMWRFRLPETTRPELVTVVCVGGVLIVTVPKMVPEEEDGGFGQGANRYYYMCMNELLAFGGGGSFALCLDEDLLKATSGPSETFGNECLASSTEFELKNVELWGFAHASQYLFS